MLIQEVEENVVELVETLNFAEKVERSLELIDRAYQEFGEGLVVANSLGKDSSAVWHLARQVRPDIRGFIVTTRFKPKETKQFMADEVSRCPELQIFSNDQEIPEKLYETDPDRCCEILKVEPTRTRTNYKEIEELDKGLIKLNPILIWYEREVWQYLALNQVPVNPLYAKGYRSLGCAPCTRIAQGADERAGRWIGTSKCGGECGIHTKPLLDYQI